MNTSWSTVPTLPYAEQPPTGYWGTDPYLGMDPRSRQIRETYDARERQAEKVRQAAALAGETGASWVEDPNTGLVRFRSGGGGAGSAVDFASSLKSIPGAVGPWSHPSESEDERALSASYARARDRAGLEAQGAAKSIGALMNRRGLAGSKFGASQEAKGVRYGLDRLGEYNRDEAIQLAKRKQAVADRNYAGGLTARAQDITAQGNRVNQALSLSALKARSQAY